MDIQFQIENEEDIYYLKKIENKKIEKVLQIALSIGLKSIQMSEVNMDCHSYIDPIKGLISDSTEKNKDTLISIETKLDDLLHIKTNSSRKGQLSEDICRNILMKTYTSWDFVDVSQIGYEGDCRAFETPVGQILYEFKSYDHNVNREQVSKFIRDLDYTNIRYGIFVSNTSGIVGRKNIEWEIIDDKLIIYVSNMGLNGYGCILGTELLLSLIKINILDKDKNWIFYQNIELDEIMGSISIGIDMLRKNIEDYTKHKQLISDQRIKINNCIDLLEKNSFDCLLDLNHTLNTIINKTKDINSTVNIINSDFSCDSFLKKQKNEKFKVLFEKLIKLCGNHTISTFDEELIIKIEDKILLYTKTSKSKINLLFPIGDDKIIINFKYERVKGNEIIIDLKDDMNIWEIIKDRLNY